MTSMRRRGGDSVEQGSIQLRPYRIPASCPAAPEFSDIALLAGILAERVKDRMMALGARRKQLEAELWAAPEAHPVRLHPGMADNYRVRVRELVAALADGDPIQAIEAREAVHALVDRIVLTPSDDDPLVPVVNLEGALVGLLALATGAHVADSPQMQKPASGREAGFSESMLKLAAGPRFGHWLQLSRAYGL